MTLEFEMLLEETNTGLLDVSLLLHTSRPVGPRSSTLRIVVVAQHKVLQHYFDNLKDRLKH